MKKLFTFLSRANNNSVGLNFNYRRVSSIYSMLTLMAIMLMAPQGVKAETITTPYNFDFSQSDNKTITWSEETESGCTFFETVGGQTNYTRFATQGTGWDLTTKAGLYNLNPARNFLVKNLYAGDVVTFNVSTNSTYGTDVAVVSNGTKSGNTFTVTSKGSLIVTIPRNSFITSITIQHETSEAWGYDPAIETYDLYYVDTNIQSLANAGFNLDYDDYEAQYLTLSSGLALNNRIAISQVEYNGGHYTPWKINHGFESQYNWHNISITNLVEGDRVVITWMGDAKFSSTSNKNPDVYNGCAAFKDVENNGDFDEGQDNNISLGMYLDAKEHHVDYYAQEEIYTSYPYVITEDGHLDIALSAGSKIVKVVIYADHQAQMVDKDNALGTSTSYFNTTGQLEAKHHIVPGGLHVYIGNDNDAEHAEVVMSDKGPVSFVYDHINDDFSHHYKMARLSGWGRFDVWDDLPATGTFYRFVPEVSGKMWVKFKAASVNYREYGIAGNAAVDNNGTPNEVTNNVSCPYYLIEKGDWKWREQGWDNEHQVNVAEGHWYYEPIKLASVNLANGDDGYFGNDSGNPTSGQDKGITVERGKFE